jgi:hypothetical protein
VIAMTSTSCPLSKKYLPTLVELAGTADDVVWLLVNPVATDTAADMQAAAARFADRVIYAHDPEGRLAATIGATSTTDVIVIAPDRTIAYHGAIDDQYGFGYALDAPRTRYLADALAAIRVGAEPRVAATEKADLVAWLTGGRPEGDPGDTPARRHYPADGWQIGTPDAVFEFAEPVPVKATDVMPYQTVIVETHLPADRWVQAIEVQPGDRNVVHHALIHLAGAEEEPGDPRDAAAEERGGFWGEYVPGQNTLVYPTGFAKKLPKGARLRFQMHYTPNGTATTDRTRVGVIWAKEPPEHEVRVAGIVNARISIPPGAADHREEASLRLPFDATIMGFLPHLHVRGKACRYEVVRGDGARSTVLDIPRYDFNWQLLYRLHEPLTLAAGDTLVFTAWYDNSAGNPANLDPTKTVRWGPQTFDEMHLGYVEYVVPGVTHGTLSRSSGPTRVPVSETPAHREKPGSA